MKNPRTKKYPIFTYLCWLLVVAMLFTGVTFSRYSITRSGSLSTDIASLNCGYTVDGINSLLFDNNNHSGSSSANTVRFTLKNYTEKTETVDGVEHTDKIISEVDVEGGLRLYLPADLADNLAIQITGTNVSNVLTPQIVLGELFYGKSGDTDKNGNVILNDSYKQYSSTDKPFSTSNFTDYGARNYPDENWTVGGTLANNGTLTVNNTQTTVDGATVGSGIDMTVSAGSETDAYSIGFQRGTVSAPLYLDLEKQVTYYTIDISLPEMYFTAGVEKALRYVVHFTLVRRIAPEVNWNNEAGNNIYLVAEGQNLSPDAEIVPMSDLITKPPANGYEYVAMHDGERVKITGFHFEQEAPTVGGSNSNGQTTVRVKCTYNNQAEYAEDGIYTSGGYNVSLFHVARINNSDTDSGTGDDSQQGNQYNGEVVHPLLLDNNTNIIENVTFENMATLSSIFNILDQTQVTGTCTASYNPVTINLTNVSIDPLHNSDGSGISVTYGISRSYNFKMRATFVQASQTPSQGGTQS